MARDVEIGRESYQGKPLVTISWEGQDRYPFSFGVAKAKLLKAALKQNPQFLQEFIKENEDDE